MKITSHRAATKTIIGVAQVETPVDCNAGDVDRREDSEIDETGHLRATLQRVRRRPGVGHGRLRRLPVGALS